MDPFELGEGRGGGCCCGKELDEKADDELMTAGRM